MDMQLDPEMITALSREYENPYDPDHFMTPLERAMIALYKARPIRMKRFIREYQWVRSEIHKLGVEL